jgi:predicted DNA-binding transcriptional regulator AlpA
MTSTSDSQLVTAAEAARILGVTRGRVVELATSTADFPAAETTATGGRRWHRAAIEAWTAANPDRGPRHPGLKIPPIGQWPWQVQRVVDLAHDEARALHHDWVAQDRLLLALLHPDCPGAARAVLESFGVTAAPLREAWVASMGDPYEPHHRGILFAAGQQELERANLEALALADAEVASEHVLLALTTRRDRSFGASWLQRHGVDAAPLRQRSWTSPRAESCPSRRRRLRSRRGRPSSIRRPGWSWRRPPRGAILAAGARGAQRCSPTPTARLSATGWPCASTSSTGTETRS